MVECQSSKLIMRVRFPLPAPNLKRKEVMGSHTREGHNRTIKTKTGTKTVRVKNSKSIFRKKRK